MIRPRTGLNLGTILSATFFNLIIIQQGEARQTLTGDFRFENVLQDHSLLFGILENNVPITIFIPKRVNVCFHDRGS